MDLMILYLNNFSHSFLIYMLQPKIIRKKEKMKEDLHHIVVLCINIPEELISISFSESLFLVKILIQVNGNLKEFVYYAKLNDLNLYKFYIFMIIFLFSNLTKKYFFNYYLIQFFLFYH
jgi:hypothetical protein